MRSFSVFVYISTILLVILDLIFINVLLNPHSIDFLTKIGIFSEVNSHNMKYLVILVLVLSIISCIMLFLSFILVLRRLFTNPYKVYNKGDL